MLDARKPIYIFDDRRKIPFRTVKRVVRKNSDVLLGIDEDDDYVLVNLTNNECLTEAHQFHFATNERPDF